MTVYCTYRVLGNCPWDGVHYAVSFISRAPSTAVTTGREPEILRSSLEHWRGRRRRRSRSRLGINERRCSSQMSSPPMQQQALPPPTHQTVQCWHDLWWWPWCSSSPQSIKRVYLCLRWKHWAAKHELKWGAVMEVKPGPQTTYLHQRTTTSVLLLQNTLGGKEKIIVAHGWVKNGMTIC